MLNAKTLITILEQMPPETEVFSGGDEVSIIFQSGDAGVVLDTEDGFESESCTMLWNHQPGDLEMKRYTIIRDVVMREVFTVNASSADDALELAEEADADGELYEKYETKVGMPEHDLGGTYQSTHLEVVK